MKRKERRECFEKKQKAETGGAELWV